VRFQFGLEPSEQFLRRPIGGQSVLSFTDDFDEVPALPLKEFQSHSALPYRKQGRLEKTALNG